MGGRQKGKECSPYSTIFTTELSELAALISSQKLITLITDHTKVTKKHCQPTKAFCCQDK
jgi:hypothetical protein